MESRHANIELKEKKYYPFMDGFRAIAAFWVILHHIFYFFKMDEVFYDAYVIFLSIFSINLGVFFHSLELFVRTWAFHGNLGVDMFFVISGFLITGLLTEDLGGDVPIKRFYIRRAFKILPQYFFAVIFVIIFYEVIPPFTVTDGAVPQASHVQGAVIWSYFLFLQNYFIQIPMLDHTWSLVVEEHFYLFFPLILWLICSLQKDTVRRRKSIILACFFVLISCNFIRFYFETGIPWLNGMLHAPYYFQTTLYRVDALAMGCLLKLFESRLSLKGKSGEYWAPLLFLLGMGIYLLFYMGKVFVQDHSLGGRWYAFTLAYLAPSLIFIAALRGFTPLKCIVEYPVLRYIGKNSYGIYLWHYILIFPATFLVPYWGTGLTVIFYFFVTIMVGIVTTTTIEKYFLFLRSKIAP